MVKSGVMVDKFKFLSRRPHMISMEILVKLDSKARWKDIYEGETFKIKLIPKSLYTEVN